MGSKTTTYDFTEGNIVKQLFIFASPLFLSSLLQILYNVADMIIVGQFIGTNGLSGVSVGADVTNLLMFVSMGFSNAGQIIISQQIGAKKQDLIGRFITTMLIFLLSSAIIMSFVCLFFRYPLLYLMNTPEEAMSDALAYSTVSITGLVFIYGYNAVSAILRGLGDSKHPFIFIAVAAVTNVILDLLFVVVLKAGTAGAALATVISQGISFIWCLVFMIRSKEKLGISITPSKLLCFDFGMFVSLVKLGIPMAIKTASIQISKLFVNSFVNSYGVEVSAFAGIANKINSISILVSNSLNTAGASMVGQNIGAKKFDRVPVIIRTILMTTLLIALILSLTVVLFPNAVFGMFTREQPVLDIAADYLPIAVLIFFGSACRAGMNALINGSGNTALNFATAILDGIVLRLGLSALFGLYLDMRHIGFWLGDALAGFTPFFIGIVFYFSGRWKKNIFKQ